MSDDSKKKVQKREEDGCALFTEEDEKAWSDIAETAKEFIENCKIIGNFLARWFKENEDLWQPYMEKVYYDEKNKRLYIFEEDLHENVSYKDFDEFVNDLRKAMKEDYGVEVSTEYANKSALNINSMLRLIAKT